MTVETSSRARGTRPLALSRVMRTVCGFAAAATAAFAAGTEVPSSHPPDLTQLSLEQLLEIEVPTVVAASRYAQKVTEAPSSVTIITAKEISTFGYRTLADALRSVRDMYVSYDRNYSYLGVRGFSRPGDYNSRVLLMVDGHRQNDNVYEEALIGSEFILDVDLIDHIEVVRGPGSSLYGTSAFLAVVNVVTRAPSDRPGGEIALSPASFGTYSGRITYGKQLEDGPGFLLSGSGLKSEGQRLFYEEFDSPATNYGVVSDADYERLYSGFAKLSWKGFSVEAALSSRTKGIPTASFGTIFGDRGTKTLDERSFLDLGYETSLGGGADLSAHLYYDHYYYTGDYNYDYPPVTINRDKTTGSWVGFDGRASFRLQERDNLTIGFEAQDNLRQDQRNFDVSPRFDYLDSRRSTTNLGAYVQNELTLARWLGLNAGVRYDHYETFGGTTNPRLSLIFRPNAKSAIKAIYGRAFRAPSPYELYYGSPAFDQRTNPDLVPEKIKTWELAYDQYFGDGLRISASAFQYRIDDLISLKTNPADGSLAFENVDSALSRGAGVELEKRWRAGWSARVSFDHARARDTDTGHRLSNSPEHLAKMNVAAPILGDRLAAGLEVQYMGSRNTVREGRTGGSTLANLTLTSRDLTRGLTVSTSVDNLFDRRYADPGSEEHRQDAILQDGRSLRLKLIYAF